MQLVIITGLSGAGKALAARTFEDMAYTVVDNLPPALLPALVSQTNVERMAVVMDARTPNIGTDWASAVKAVKQSGVKPVVLFLEATDAVLIQRFKETRRPHPLFGETGSIPGAIDAERQLLEPIRADADKVIDTSDLTAPALRLLLTEAFGGVPDKNSGLLVTCLSFGFKHGVPLDADLVFDVRFLINPHYVDGLRPFDGRDPQVEQYVMADPNAPVFLDKLYDLLDWSLPQYVREGKAYLTVAIGCTGGRHRSVMVAEKLAAHLSGLGYRASARHRDVGRVTP